MPLDYNDLLIFFIDLGWLLGGERYSVLKWKSLGMKCEM